MHALLVRAAYYSMLGSNPQRHVRVSKLEAAFCVCWFVSCPPRRSEETLRTASLSPGRFRRGGGARKYTKRFKMWENYIIPPSMSLYGNKSGMFPPRRLLASAMKAAKWAVTADVLLGLSDTF